ncbi:SNARE Sec20 [Schizosaccharomyces cryophilus OY26]|uniref:SNARE Sec20 n=1 Tax=Schizosaccharomyces cryophilus (strain OY26 / ATCC MYA-4695 / CBS 11777 / NBRC 106824 / NRRL Y48691) TaxID=653667 RepID=S9X2X5_SCHCR|nr:SNARE Sec20 [Schizosaccharomyces cryophilus OY26]EPY51442.1 SNARE Sec20 [Schizosaccharomyces cryophilus OY26]
MAEIIHLLELKVSELQRAETSQELKLHFREFRRLWESARVEFEYSAVDLDLILRYEKSVQEYIRLNKRFKDKIAAGIPWISIASERNALPEVPQESSENIEVLGANEPELLTTDDMHLTSASQVTAAMRDLHVQMVQAVDMSAENSNELASSTSLLESLQEKYFSVEDVLYASKKIMRSLKLNDQKDYYLVISGFGFFMFVLFYLLWKRIIWPILSMFFWFLR